MTVTGEPQRPLPPEADPAARPPRRRDAGAVLEVCPFLAAETASWRSAYAAREHRCHAVRPAALLAISKQRQLCLTSAHEACTTYLAARAVAAEAVPTTPGDDGARLWSATASTPLVLEPARRMGAIPGASARGGGQALLVGLMVLAFLVLVIARTQSPAVSGGSTPDPAAATQGAAVASASPAPASTPSPAASGSAAPAPSASAPASAPPQPTPAPASGAPPASSPVASPAATATATRRYRVKSGDTLSSIAARYGTTVKVLAALNDIADPRFIRIGQLLLIP